MNEDSLRRTQKQLITCMKQLNTLVNDHVLAATERIVFRFGDIMGWSRYSSTFASIGWNVSHMNMLKRLAEDVYVGLISNIFPLKNYIIVSIL